MINWRISSQGFASWMVEMGLLSTLGIRGGREMEVLVLIRKRGINWYRLKSRNDSCHSPGDGKWSWLCFSSITTKLAFLSF